jgi:hypothetical protein
MVFIEVLWPWRRYPRTRLQVRMNCGNTTLESNWVFLDTCNGLATLIWLVFAVFTWNICVHAVCSDCTYWSHDRAKKTFACGAKVSCDMKDDSWNCSEVISSRQSVEREVSVVSRVTMKPCHVTTLALYVFSVFWRSVANKQEIRYGTLLCRVECWAQTDCWL